MMKYLKICQNNNYIENCLKNIAIKNYELAGLKGNKSQLKKNKKKIIINFKIL